MSELVPWKGQQIAKAFAGIAPGPSLGENVEGLGFSSVRYRGKQWSLQHAGHNYPFVRADDGSPLTFLDMVIIAQQPKISKAYFPGDFTEDSASGPICTSLRGDVPDPGVSIKQSANCGTCKQNQWSTRPNGGRYIPCQSYQRLAVLVWPALTKKLLGAPLLDPLFFKVPPGSLQALKTYGEELRDEGYACFVGWTRVTFHADKLFQMVFAGSPIGMLKEKEAEFVTGLLNSPITRRIVGDLAEVREVEGEVAGQVREESGLLEAIEEQQPVEQGSVQTPKTSTASTPTPIRAERRRAPIGDKQAVAAKPTPKQAEPGPEEVAWTDSEEDLDASIAETTNKTIADMMK
jgi:hypothetical protein